MADLTLANSGYQSGAIDTATTLVDNVDTVKAQHVNGPDSACIQIETILGSGPTIKGTVADLATRLAVLLDTDGTLLLSGFKGLTIDRGLLASSSTAMAVMNHTPIGIISPYGGASAPTNWLLCDGSAVNRTTYAKLFTAISTAYGTGDGSTTFNLPDLRGRTPIGVDGAANRITSASTNGANADTLGGVGGAETHTLTTAQLPVTSLGNILTRITDGAGANVAAAQSQTDSVGNEPHTISFGSGNAHSNTQPWQTVNYIIFAGV